MNYKEMLEASLRAARAIAQKAKDDNRSLTPNEAKAFDDHMAKANEAREYLKKVEEHDRRFEQLSAMDGDRSKGGQVLSFKGLARQLKASMEDRGGFRVKALIATDSQVTQAQTLVSPVAQAQPATSLLDLLPVRFLDGGDEYSYLTQVTRTNNAAPVAVGAVKPTSVYTLERVSRKLQVIAHVSEPIPEYWLADEPALNQFVTGEMGYGLQLAVEDQALNGNGTEPNLLGLLQVSGIQTQAFNTSQIRTVRSAITKVEVLGYLASGLALHPLDWEAIETTEDGNDRYLMGNEGSPVDRAARRLWGVPVALTTKVAQGSGVLLTKDANGQDSAGLVADRHISTQWGRVGDDFSRNQVRARVEGRFGVEVLRPTGVVAIDLAA